MILQWSAYLFINTKSFTEIVIYVVSLYIFQYIIRYTNEAYEALTWHYINISVTDTVLIYMLTILSQIKVSNILFCI